MFWLETVDGVRLEATLDGPEAPRGIVVLCHPLPTAGGTMHNPIVLAISAAVVARDWAALRFNFRGVGGSGGTFGEGVAERADVAAALDEAGRRAPGAVAVAGYSFGSSVAAMVEGAHREGGGEPRPLALVAPPFGRWPFPDGGVFTARPPCVVIGSRDQFANVDVLAIWSRDAAARVHTFPNADHFFAFRHDAVGTTVAECVAT